MPPPARLLLVCFATQAASFCVEKIVRPAAVPCTGALRSGVSSARLCAASDADVAKPLQDYVEELRRGKAALRRGLVAERGALSQDGLALALGLAKLNPTAPDPAADSDLWEGCEFTLLSSALPLLGAPPPLWQGEAKLRVEAGTATFDVQVLEGAIGAASLLGPPRSSSLQQCQGGQGCPCITFSTCSRLPVHHAYTDGSPQSSNCASLPSPSRSALSSVCPHLVLRCCSQPFPSLSCVVAANLSLACPPLCGEALHPRHLAEYPHARTLPAISADAGRAESVPALHLLHLTAPASYALPLVMRCP
jgi:hypothetical protein